MKKIVWKNLSPIEKVIFVIGWLSATSFVFWIALLIYHVITKEKEFFSPGSYRVVFIFGLINLVTLLVILFIVLFGLTFFTFK